MLHWAHLIKVRFDGRRKIEHHLLCKNLVSDVSVIVENQTNARLNVDAILYGLVRGEFFQVSMSTYNDSFIPEGELINQILIVPELSTNHDVNLNQRFIRSGFSIN